MQDIDIEVDGLRVTIDLSRTGLIIEMLENRVQELLPLLRALLSADSSWFALSEINATERRRGFMAMNMKCQIAIHIATKNAELLKSIAEGDETIADHGFPEFYGAKQIDL